MPLQDLPLVEGQRAVRAVVGPLAGVGPLVAQDLGGRREPLAAELAGVRPPPVPQVLVLVAGDVRLRLLELLLVLLLLLLVLLVQLLLVRVFHVLLVLLLVLLLEVFLMLLAGERGGPTPSLTTTTNTPWAHLQWREIKTISNDVQNVREVLLCHGFAV